jgi:hypothetical protein
MYGGKVIKRLKSAKSDKDKYNYDEYYNYIKGLTIDEFSDLVKSDSLDKSYTATDKNIRRKFIKKYYILWVNQTYMKLFHEFIQSNRKLTNKSIDWLNHKVENMNIPKMGVYRRIERLVDIYSMVRQPKHLSCIVFSLKNTNKPGIMRTNYGYLYLDNKSKGSTSSFDFLYMCAGPNIVSSDGEFRSKLTISDSINIYKYYYKNIWDTVGEYLLSKNNIVYFQDYYLYGDISDEQIDNLKKIVDINRYVIDLYILSWISQYLLIYLNVQSINIDRFYNDNMFDIVADRVIFDKIVEKESIATIKLFYRDTSVIYSSYKEGANKFRLTEHPEITHINQESYNNIMNIEYSVWLECYISQMVTNIYINSITPGVPMFHDWSILYGVNKFMFNNEEIYNKAEISDNMIGQNKEDKMIEYSPDEAYEDNIYSTDKAILFIMEYVGRPVNDLATLLKSQEFQENIESIFSNYDYFKKYMFEIIYSLYCINTKVSVIHGDLHLNNTTLNRVSKPYLTSVKGESRSSQNLGISVYVIDDDVYSFIDNGTYGTIIDFSRSFINKIQPSQIELRGDMKLIHNKQRLRIVGYYKLFFPEFYKKHGASMAIIMAKNFDISFKIFSAIDMYVHTDRLKKYIHINENILKTVPKVNKLIDKINTLTSYYLTVTMEEYLNGKIKNIEDVVNPNYNIIKRYYSSSLVNIKKDKLSNREQLSDIYIYNTDLKYSYYEYDKLLPRIKDRRIQKDNKKNVSIIDVAGAVPKSTQAYLNFRKIEILKLMGF